MKINNCEQRSEQWYKDRAGSIGGTRFGQVISGRENRLVFDLVNEMLDGHAQIEDLSFNEDVQFGIDNEPEARRLYIEKSGIQFEEVGMILSDFSNIHHHSPDGLSPDQEDVLEIKSTMNGAIHVQRFIDGPESKHLPQIINPFAVSDKVKRMHWVSFCPFRPERPLVEWIFTRETEIPDGKKTTTIRDVALKGRALIKEIEMQIPEIKNQFIF